MGEPASELQSSKLKLQPYAPPWSAKWDELVAASTNGTFLLSRRFLSYHGERFRDRSWVFVGRGDEPVAGVLAAEDPREPKAVVSHPGVTYGGWIERGEVTGAECLRCFERLAEAFRAQGYQRWRYRAVPWIYHRIPTERDRYALFRLGGKLVRSDLSSSIWLAHRNKRSLRRQRGERKALQRGVLVEERSMVYQQFWPVLESNLRSRYGRKPVHSLSEILTLQERFPESIELVVARCGGRVVAGTVLFHTDTVTHAQYIAATEEGRELSALDLAFERAIARATERGQRVFDFGISTEQEGRVLNESLERFKHEFGAGSVVYETFEVVW